MVLQEPHARRASPVPPRAELGNVVEKTVAGLGYELVDCEVIQRGRLIRVFIDRPGSEADAASQITVDDCERTTRQLQRVLEVEGIDYGRLEVSSPGLDRALKTPEAFRRFIGQQVELRLRVPVAGRRRFTGALREAGEHEVDIEVDGARRRFALADLEKARLVPKY